MIATDLKYRSLREIRHLIQLEMIRALKFAGNVSDNIHDVPVSVVQELTIEL